MKHHQLLLSVISVLTTVQAVKDTEIYPESADPRYYAELAYNPKEEKCCKGSLYPVSKPDFQKCCGSNTYDSSKQLCCSGVIKPRQRGFACCGQDTYNTDEALCCKGNIVAVSPDVIKAGTEECCGQGTYDNSKQICCKANDEMKAVPSPNGDANSCCGDIVFNTNKEVCCQGKDGDPQVHPFDESKTVCCGGELHAKGTGCCNGKPYAKAENICCGGKTWPNPKGFLRCCGRRDTYDPSSEVCCYKPSASPEGPFKTIKTDDGQDACCGLQPYSSKTDVCCMSPNGVEYIAKKSTPDANFCCGDSAYEISKGICCKGNFTEGPVFELECCGEQAVNIASSKEFCCNGILHDKNAGLYCCGNSQLFNPHKEFCCPDFTFSSSRVYAKEHDKYCCGLELINYRTEMCCDGVKHQQQENLNCCGTHVYNSDVEACCLMRPVPKIKGQNACCFIGTTDEGPKPWPENPYFGFLP